MAPFQIRTSTDKATATTRTATLLSQIHIQIRKLTNKTATTITTAKTLFSQTYLIFVIFFTQAKFLENKIYTEIYTVNCQFTQ